MNQCLSANEINGITGILNGTTNYILTKMRKEGKDFDTALENAQSNGYVEANPTSDIEGHDSCRKIAILSSIAYNEFVDYKNIHTEGIMKITLTDMEYANEMDSVIKLLAVSRKVGEKIFARVSPVIIKKANPLANVEDVFNAIVVSGDAIGDAMFYGRGAGKLPTASAVIADIIDIVKHIDSNGWNTWERKGYNNVIDIGERETRFFVRVLTRNREEAIKYILNVFGSVDFIRLDKPGLGEEIAFATIKTKEKALSEMINRLRGIGSIKDVVSTIRIEED